MKPTTLEIMAICIILIFLALVLKNLDFDIRQVWHRHEDEKGGKPSVPLGPNSHKISQMRERVPSRPQQNAGPLALAALAGLIMGTPDEKGTERIGFLCRFPIVKGTGA